MDHLFSDNKNVFIQLLSWSKSYAETSENFWKINKLYV